MNTNGIKTILKSSSFLHIGHLFIWRFSEESLNFVNTRIQTPAKKPIHFKRSKLLFRKMKFVNQLSTNRKEILTYGISMFAVLFVLKYLEANFIVINYRLDFFIGSIAILFTVLGIWLALHLVKPKIETRIVEKEVYIDSSIRAEINEDEIERLGISKRELEVLNLMSAGLSNEEIAEKLFISLNTVKTHSSNLFVKLDVKRRTQAVEKGRRLNIIAQ